MRRSAPFVLYGLGGIAVAGALVWASFAVAGQQLSAPLNPIQPVAVASSNPQPIPSRETERSPVPSPHDGQASVAMTSGTPSATKSLGGGSGSEGPSPSPGGHPRGDDLGHSGDD